MNSLRLHGHTDPISVLDVGLTEAQRSEISAECDLVRLPPGAPHNPWLLHPIVCQLRLAKTAVYIDSDIIVTAPRISSGDPAARACSPIEDRWFAAWEEIFGLSIRGRALRQRWVRFSTGHFPLLLERWSSAASDHPHRGSAGSSTRVADGARPQQPVLSRSRRSPEPRASPTLEGPRLAIVTGPSVERQCSGPWCNSGPSRKAEDMARPWPIGNNSASSCSQSRVPLDRVGVPPTASWCRSNRRSSATKSSRSPRASAKRRPRRCHANAPFPLGISGQVMRWRGSRTVANRRRASIKAGTRPVRGQPDIHSPPTSGGHLGGRRRTQRCSTRTGWAANPS